MDPDLRRTADLRFGIALLVLVLGGAVLAAYALGSQSLWLDESYSWWFTRLDWGDLLQAARIDAVNPPLYYIVVKALAPSASEAALRLPSVLAHLGGMAGAVALGFQMGGRAGAVGAGALWAVHPMTLWAARDARPYALGAALGVVAVALFIRLRRVWTARAAILVGIAIALGLLTHYFFFVLVAVLVVMAGLDLRRSPQFFRRWTVLALLAMIPLGLWLAWFFSTGSPSLGIGWIRPPTAGDMPLTAWNLASGYGGVVDLPSALFGLGVLALVGFGFVGATRGEGARWVLVGVVLPILAVWVISQRRPVYVDRYFIFLFPFVMVLASHGASTLARWSAQPRHLRAWWALLAAAAVTIALSAAWTVHSAPKFMKEDWRGLASFVQGQGASAESLALSEPEIALPLSYYVQQDFIEDGLALVPACADRCWWILRQPYTATHAFTQSVTEPGRSHPPDIPPWCRQLDVWESPTGLAVWEIDCVREATDE